MCIRHRIAGTDMAGWANNGYFERCWSRDACGFCGWYRLDKWINAITKRPSSAGIAGREYKRANLRRKPTREQLATRNEIARCRSCDEVREAESAEVLIKGLYVRISVA